MTPEKDQAPIDAEELPQNVIEIPNEEEKEPNVISEVQNFQTSEGQNIQSEQVYDLNNPLNERISNRSLRDTIRSESQGIQDSERQTEGLELLDKVKKFVDKQGRDGIPDAPRTQFIPQRPHTRSQDKGDQTENNLAVVAEVIDDKQSEDSFVQSVNNMSSDNSVAAPPEDVIEVGDDRDPNIVYQAESSESQDRNSVVDHVYSNSSDEDRFHTSLYEHSSSKKERPQKFKGTRKYRKSASKSRK